MLDAKEIVTRLRQQMTRNIERDGRWDDIRQVRNGNLSAIAPGLFTEEYQKPIVANFIDSVARDLAELVAPLPAFQCASASMQSDEARKFADKRTKILQAYIQESKLDRQMLEASDHFNTYSLGVFYIEPDFDLKMPRILVEDPMGAYPDLDRWGRIRSYLKRFHTDAYSLSTLFPEFAGRIYDAEKSSITGASRLIEIVRYCDSDQVALVLVQDQPILLMSTPNPLGEPPIVIARRPWLHRETYKGQFDDVVWVQIARDILARLNIEAVTKSIEAPLALPPDVQEIALGPDSIIRTSMPDKVQRVPLEIPQGAFAESAILLEEMRQGARYPAARTGGVDASVITGRGVQALLGGFDSQIKSAQLAFRDALIDVGRLCFKTDETYWPEETKSIRGQANGTPYEIKYRPSKDIAGDHSLDCEYGFAAGMDPNRAVVMLLQLRAEKAFSRDYFIRQLPFAINVNEEMSKVDVEETREALKQGVYAYVQAIPALAAQGIDPAEAVGKLAAIVKGLQAGDKIEDVVTVAFAPAPAPAIPAAGPGELAGGPGGGAANGAPGAAATGVTPSGRLVGVPPGQAGQAPGGRPDLSVMLAGLTGSGNPQLSAYVNRRRRV